MLSLGLDSQYETELRKTPCSSAGHTSTVIAASVFECYCDLISLSMDWMMFSFVGAVWEPVKGEIIFKSARLNCGLNTCSLFSKVSIIRLL